MTVAEQVSERRLSILLRVLRGKRGRGTELISLYVPPGRQISEVMETLRDEHGKASNIKSRTTRKNVQEAITKTTQRLKAYDKAPETGLVLFCGSIPRGAPGAEVIELYEIIPPKPVNVSYYSCDDSFYLEPLLEMVRPQEVLGVVLVENSEATIAKVEGKNVEILGNYTSGVPGKSSKGGQSARRFERLREMVLNGFYTRVGDHVNDAFLAMPKLTKIIVGGPGTTKNEFLQGKYLNYQLRDKVAAIVDTSYTEEQGVKEALEKAAEKLERIDLVEERRAVQRFLAEISRDSGLAVYGEEEVKRALESHKVMTLLISEDLDDVVVKVSCSSCGNEEERRVGEPELELMLASVRSEYCSKCSNSTLTAEPQRRVFDELLRMAEEGGAEVEVVSSKTEEGRMLLKGFGGVAALLRR